LVTSRLDYGNVLLYLYPNCNSSSTESTKQCCSSNYPHSEEGTHHSSIEILTLATCGYRPQYKLLMYTYKALNSTAPVYLEEPWIPYHPRRSLRSEAELAGYGAQKTRNGQPIGENSGLGFKPKRQAWAPCGTNLTHLGNPRAGPRAPKTWGTKKTSVKTRTSFTHLRLSQRAGCTHWA